jgi:hypothetical protein
MIGTTQKAFPGTFLIIRKGQNIPPINEKTTISRQKGEIVGPKGSATAKALSNLHLA